jgi:hypothetical protein
MRSQGGGLFSYTGTINVQNSTLSGNSTQGPNAPGGGVYDGFGRLTVTGSTVAGNSTQGTGSQGGGAAVGEAPVTVDSSIVATNNSAAGSPDLGLLIFSEASLTHSLLGNNQGTQLTATGLTPDANGNLIGSPTSPVDPLLGPLQDNGGPTPTRALLPGSPALGRGDNSLSLATDQRGPGFLRAINGSVDMGAFQTQSATVIIITKPPPVTSPGPSPVPMIGDVTHVVNVILGTLAPGSKGKGKPFTATLTVRNTSGGVVAGPLHLVLNGLKKTIKVKNVAGFVGSKKKKRPFVTLPVAGGNLTSGSSASLTVQFSGKPNHFTVTVFAGTPPK